MCVHVGAMKRWKAASGKPTTPCCMVVAFLAVLVVQQTAATGKEGFDAQTTARNTFNRRVWSGDSKLRGPMPNEEPDEPLMQVVTFGTPAFLSSCFSVADQSYKDGATIYPGTCLTQTLPLSRVSWHTHGPWLARHLYSTFAMQEGDPASIH